MRFSVKQTLIGVFVGLQLAAVALILFSSYVSTERVLLAHARQLMEGVASNIVRRSLEFLQPAQVAADLTQRLADNDIVTSAQPSRMERYFYEQLRLYPQFAGLYFGAPDGAFYYVSRSNEKVRGGYRTKFITTGSDGKRQVELIWRGIDFREIDRASTPDDPYDPRTRPWYTAAVSMGGLIWTDPYLFYTSRQPGITVASPVFPPGGSMRGVVGVDIEITEISAFLAQNRIAPGSSAFILNRNGDVIAFPDSEKIKRSAANADGSLRFTKIEELDDAASRAAFASLGVAPQDLALDEPVFTTFESGGQTYHGVFSPFRDSNWPWVIGVYVPESYYLGAIKDNQALNLWFGVAIAALTSLLGWVLAANIAGPVARLGSRARAVTRKGLMPDEDAPIHSRFREIQETISAFSQMLESLRAQERRNTELTSRLTRISRVVEEGPVAVVITDDGGRIEYVNPRFTEMTGFTLQEAVGRTPAILKSERTPPEIHAEMWRTIRAGRVWQGELVNRHRDGRDYWVALTIAPLLEPTEDGRGRRVTYIAISEDITARKEAEAELHRLNEQLEQRVEERTRELRDEIAERRRIEAALRAAKEQAEKANQAKSQFLSSMSHELRTPMNGILGFAQLLETSPEPLTAQQREFLQLIRQSGQHLLDLINQVLDLAKIEAGRVGLSIEPVDCRDVVRECLPVARILAGGRGVSVIEAEPACETPVVMADFVRLKQVLLNLLSNAVKYNRHGGTVIIACAPGAGDTMRVSIADTGEGIPPEFNDSLFEPFRRIHDGHGRVEGTGIGLAITRQLVELMNGRIGFESTLGEGTTFWFELPLAAGTPERAHRRRPPRLPPPQRLPHGATILYIEDNPANLRLMEGVVARLPAATLLTAHNAELGLELALARRPDLILMDINLPQMDGFAALERLRKAPDTRRIPVIALTANAMPGDRERALAAGFHGYLPKPIDLAQVLQAITEALESA